MNNIFKRFYSIFIARNKEYFRDRAAFGWNFLFPFLIILGFTIIFQNKGQTEYKIGIIPPKMPAAQVQVLPLELNQLKLAMILEFNDRKTGFNKLKHHKIDLLIEKGSLPLHYWLNQSSPKGNIAESLLLRALYSSENHLDMVVKSFVNGPQIHYINWLFPGIIAMSMMFSALYGVGYTIVRYRKNGVLKRLQATPLTAFEYLSAQVVSRLFLILISNFILYTGCAFIFKFKCAGSYLDLILIFALGSICIISISLLVAAKISSEELANGILNLISWPMMFLSEVWFSLEGSGYWVKFISHFFPLKHITEAMRLIINEGVGLYDLKYHIAVLTGMSIVFMIIGSLSFKWTET